MNTINDTKLNSVEAALTKESFIQSLRLALDASDLHIEDSESTKAETNTLSIRRTVLGVAYPRTLEQLQHIVRAAAKFGVALYPVSQGKNIGYGDMTPTGSNQLVVGLKHLNKIRAYNPVAGEVEVEPGVTQAQLAAYLSQRGGKFWADVTGATPEASLIGNTLEAGFGHTPIGDHRKHIVQMELMFADGTMLTTAEMPSIGPDLSQLFVQSNFAIVTAMKIPLFPVPEKTVTFAISFASDAKFFEGIAILSGLRRDGTISSLLHTGNSTRALMTASRFPADCDRAQVLSEADCEKILNNQKFNNFGRWSSVGGLYGYSDDIRNKQRRIKKAFKGVAQVKFFTDAKMNFLDKIVNSKLLRNIESFKLVRNSFQSIKGLHGIMRGQPSFGPTENIFWRVDNVEKLGLLWHAPVIPATRKDCDALLFAARKVYAQYGFEMPVTLTLIDQKHMTAVFNISYDKTNPEEIGRAHSAYKALSEATVKLGYLPYRCGLASQPKKLYSPEQLALLEKIKAAVDPQNILAPGRYGLGATLEN